MDAPIEFSPATVAALVALLTLSLVIYGRLAWRLHRSGGLVGTDKIVPGDMGIAAGIGGLLALLATASFLGTARQIRFMDIVSGSVHFLFLLMLIGAFLLYRRVNLVEFFGLRRAGFFKVAVGGLALLFAAYPVVILASAITQKCLGTEAKPQELVKFFLEIAQAKKESRILLVLGFAVLFGPACEEVIFRGYIYPVFKRYAGMWPGMIASAALFAFIHANLASLPALFLLAVCLTIAYEITGSLAVPYVMHATFNFLSLGALLCATFTPTR